MTSKHPVGGYAPHPQLVTGRAEVLAEQPFDAWSRLDLESTLDARAATAPRAPEKYLVGPGVPGLISVVIPTFNRAAIVGGAIESALEQSYGNVEILIVDDGSTDDTQSVVERYGARVRYLFQPNNGVSSARNLGFAHARGEFIALLDSDDRFLRWKLEAQVRVLRGHPDVGMVWTDMTAVTAAGIVVDPTYLRTFYTAHAIARLEQRLACSGSLGQLWPDAPPTAAAAPIYTGDIFSPMLLGNLVHTSTVLLRRDRLRQVGGFDESFAVSGEDYEFHIRTCSYGAVAFLDASSLLYRVGAADQLTAPQFAVHIARNNLTTVLRWLKLGRTRINLPDELVRSRLAQAFHWVGETELEVGHRATARTFFLRSLRYTRPNRRAALLLAATALPTGALRAARTVTRAARHLARLTLIPIRALGIGVR